MNDRYPRIKYVAIGIVFVNFRTGIGTIKRYQEQIRMALKAAVLQNGSLGCFKEERLLSFVKTGFMKRTKRKKPTIKIGLNQKPPNWSISR